MNFGHELMLLEGELFSDAIPKEQLLGYKRLKADMNLVSSDVIDPVREKIIRMSKNACRQVNNYLHRKGLKPVDLPSYLEIKDMPEISGFLFPDDDKFHVLPVGNVGASYNTNTDGITFYRAMVPKSKENEELIGIYKQSMRTACRLMQKYTELKKPLQKLARFYATMINALQDPEKAEVALVHEYGHKAAQDRKNRYGESLNNQLMSASLNNGNKRKAVEAVEGFNVLLTDEITGRKTTEEGTTYDAFGTRMRQVLNRYGKTPADVLSGTHNNIGKEISHSYINLN